jgi:hypothetical protein
VLEDGKMEKNKIDSIKIEDFKLDFEEKELMNEQNEFIGEMDTKTRTTRTIRYITKVTCRGSCTCNCTAICFA